jgi:hypothetical protein
MLTSLYCLAALLEELDSEEANAFYQRAISGYVKVLGPDHSYYYSMFWTVFHYA